MQEVDITSIMRRFDEFVQASLTKKTQKSIPQPSGNQFDVYFQNMQKRLKIKTVTQDQKFQRILAPMKKLKSFVSIKDFLRGLNNKPPKKNNSLQTLSQQTKTKLQYEDLRGGLYMQKVENHLKRNNLKRKIDDQAELLLKQLQQSHSDKNDYGQWMENILSKISMKEETFLKVNEQKKSLPKNRIGTEKMMIFQDLTNKDEDNLKSSRMENYQSRINQQRQQKNFKKVSDFLTERLKRILNDKYVKNSSNGKKNRRNLSVDFSSNEELYDNCRMLTQPPENSIKLRKVTCRTSGSSRRQNARTLLPRSQTSQLKQRKVIDDVWKNKVVSKMDNLMITTNTYYKKCRQEKKQYKNIINPFCQINKDSKR